MITNLVASIFFTITTNEWRTTSTIIPATATAIEYGGAVHAVYRPTISNQTGTIRSNTVALIRWNGRTNEVVIESIAIGWATRQIDAMNPSQR